MADNNTKRGLSTGESGAQRLQRAAIASAKKQSTQSPVKPK